MRHVPNLRGSVSRRLRAHVAEVHPWASEADACREPDIDRQAGQKNSAARRVGRIRDRWFTFSMRRAIVTCTIRIWFWTFRGAVQ